MSYYSALDPELHLDARDLAAVWNATPARCQLAEAELVEMTPKGFSLDPQLVQQRLILLAGARTLVLESLKDALKEKLTEYFKEKLGPNTHRPQSRIRPLQPTPCAR